MIQAEKDERDAMKNAEKEADTEYNLCVERAYVHQKRAELSPFKEILSVQKGEIHV